MARVIRAVAMTVFTLLLMVVFAAIVYGANTVTSLYESTRLIWDVGGRMLARAWEGDATL